MSMIPMKLPMNLQFFAEGGAGSEPPAASQPPPVNQTPPGSQALPVSTPSAPAIDYSKIQQMLEGTLSAKEDTALKAYFKQQGLSQEEMTQAISAFKQQKAEQQPDVSALQTQAAQAQEAVQRVSLENTAILEAVALGIDAKTIPYILKLADFSKAAGQDGSADRVAMQAAINKVLEEVPALKQTPGQTMGFIQVGASGNPQDMGQNEQLAAIFGNKK